jgi:acetyl-CoA acetyltransferase
VRGSCALVGLGVTAQGIGLGLNGRELRAQAVDLALADAGLERAAIDGYIHTYMDREDLRYMGLSPNFSLAIQTGGATPVFGILTAIGAILSGQAEMVACVYGQAQSARVAAGGQQIGAYAYGYPSLYGLIGAAATHALHARRHMHLYGTTSQHLGAVAVTQRRYAAVRPGTLGFGKPITLEDHQASPMIADPFRRLDCTRDTDGGCAVLVTTMERARTMQSHPVYILGAGTGHNIANCTTVRSTKTTTTLARRKRVPSSRRACHSQTSTWRSSTTLSRSPRSCSSKRTASCLKVAADRFTPKAVQVPMDRFRPTRVVVSYRRITRRASRELSRLCCSCAAKQAQGNLKELIQRL